MSARVEDAPLPKDAQRTLRELPAYWQLLQAHGVDKKTLLLRLRALCTVARTLELRVEQLGARVREVTAERDALLEEIKSLRRRRIWHGQPHWVRLAHGEEWSRNVIAREAVKMAHAGGEERYRRPKKCIRCGRAFR